MVEDACDADPPFSAGSAGPELSEAPADSAADDSSPGGPDIDTSAVDALAAALPAAASSKARTAAASASASAAAAVTAASARSLAAAALPAAASSVLVAAVANWWARYPALSSRRSRK